MSIKTRYNISNSGIDVQKQFHLLERIPAFNLKELIDTLLKLRKLKSFSLDVNIPWTTFHLKSGRDLKGWPVNISQNDDNNTIQIYNSNPGTIDPASTIFDTIFINIDSIEAITVHDMAGSAYLFSKGGISSIVDSSPCNFEEIDKKLHAFKEFFSIDLGVEFNIEMIKTDIKEDSLESINVLDFIRDSLLGLYRWLDDDANKKVFSKGINTLSFKNSKEFNISLEKKSLVLGRPVNNSEKEWSTPNEIMEKIAIVIKN